MPASDHDLRDVQPTTGESDVTRHLRRAYRHLLDPPRWTGPATANNAKLVLRWIHMIIVGPDTARSPSVTSNLDLAPPTPPLLRSPSTRPAIPVPRVGGLSLKDPLSAPERAGAIRIVIFDERPNRRCRVEVRHGTESAVCCRRQCNFHVIIVFRLAAPGGVSGSSSGSKKKWATLGDRDMTRRHASSIHTWVRACAGIR